MLTITSEKQLCIHLVNNWDDYFGKAGIHLCKQEYHVELFRPRQKSRIDFLAWRLKENFKVPIYIEVKFGDKSSRDLIFELEKILVLKNTRHSKMSDQTVDIVVLADVLDDTIKNYLKQNNITWLRYEFISPDKIIDNRLLNINKGELYEVI